MPQPLYIQVKYYPYSHPTPPPLPLGIYLTWATVNLKFNEPPLLDALGRCRPFQVRIIEDIEYPMIITDFLYYNTRSFLTTFSDFTDCMRKRVCCCIKSAKKVITIAWMISLVINAFSVSKHILSSILTAFPLSNKFWTDFCDCSVHHSLHCNE